MLLKVGGISEVCKVFVYCQNQDLQDFREKGWLV